MAHQQTCASITASLLQKIVWYSSSFGIVPLYSCIYVLYIYIYTYTYTVHTLKSYWSFTYWSYWSVYLGLTRSARQHLWNAPNLVPQCARNLWGIKVELIGQAGLLTTDYWMSVDACTCMYIYNYRYIYIYINDVCMYMYIHIYIYIHNSRTAQGGVFKIGNL